MSKIIRHICSVAVLSVLVILAVGSSDSESSGSTESSGSSSSRVSQPKNEAFKKWALENTAVTDIAINQPSMFVTLTQDKYTNKENVSAIARNLARAYCSQTGASYMNCHIYLAGEEYASGRYSK